MIITVGCWVMAIVWTTGAVLAGGFGWVDAESGRHAAVMGVAWYCAAEIRTTRAALLKARAHER